MISGELRKKFLEFFEKRGHKIVPSSSLLPSDPSVLFTTAGMQQFKPYYLGKESPFGKNAASCQKCFRTSDIEEVGDESHLTFLEMLGNFSFGGYFKEEAIKLAFNFLFKEIKLPLEETFFTIFEGNENVPEDKESAEIWQKLGVSKDKIKKYGKEDNFWGPTGEEGPCGPTTEIHVRGTEIWNLVFNEYYQDKGKNLTPLLQKGVDTGMGLERLAMAVQGKSNVFETDLFEPIIRDLALGYPSMQKHARIIADHIKGAVFLASEGILPSNVERGYVLRRVLRRAIRYGKMLQTQKNFLIPLAREIIGIYENVYPELKSNENNILAVIQNEAEKFEQTLEKGLKEFEKVVKKGDISGIDVFHLFDTYGFPLELTIELASEKGFLVDVKGFKDAFEKHREISRAGVEGKFGGHGIEGYDIQDTQYKIQQLHTATHLLHAALRKVLGNDVRQMGSDITVERLRFDFAFSRKVADTELKEVEDLVNQKIKDNLKVNKEEMKYEEAIKAGALAFFKEKYPETVNVYSVNSFSKEICAGPHVDKTGELGQFKIVKEESSGAGIRRIRAILIK